MTWKMPQSNRRGPTKGHLSRLHESKMKEIRLQSDLQRRNQKDLEKPWYEKYLIEPAIQIGTTALGGALGGALGEALSPEKAAATALSKQTTGDLAEKAMSDKFTTFMQGWTRQNPGEEWNFGKYQHLLSPDLKAWAAKNQPAGR